MISRSLAEVNKRSWTLFHRATSVLVSQNTRSRRPHRRLTVAAASAVFDATRSFAKQRLSAASTSTRSFTFQQQALLLPRQVYAVLCVRLVPPVRAHDTFSATMRTSSSSSTCDVACILYKFKGKLNYDYDETRRIDQLRWLKKICVHRCVDGMIGVGCYDVVATT